MAAVNLSRWVKDRRWWLTIVPPYVALAVTTAVAQTDTLEGEVKTLREELAAVMNEVHVLQEQVAKLTPGEGGGTGETLTVTLTGTAVPQ